MLFEDVVLDMAVRQGKDEALMSQTCLLMVRHLLILQLGLVRLALKSSIQAFPVGAGMY